jgi:hypothetical protein
LQPIEKVPSVGNVPATAAERGKQPRWLTDPQFIYLLKRRSAFSTNDRAAVAAYQRFRNVLAASGAIERFAFLAFVFVHLFACFSEEEFT